MSIVRLFRRYKKTLFIFIGYKAGLAMIMVLAYYLIPVKFNSWNYVFNKTSNEDVLSVFYNWDGQHILNIASNGYEKEVSDRIAQWPLFPLLIRFTSTPGIEKYVGLFYVLLFNLLFFYVFFEFYEPIYGKDNTEKGLILFLSFPSAFFLNVLYSEILFCLLALALLQSFYKQQSYFFVLFAFLLPLSRAIGPFIGLAIGVTEILFFIQTGYNKSRLIRLTILTVAFISGLIFYFQIYQYYTGDIFASFKAQESFVFGFSLKNVIDPIHYLHLLFSKPQGINSLNKSLISIVLIWFFLGHITYLLFNKPNERVLVFIFLIVGYVSTSMGEGGLVLRYLLIPFLFVAPIFAREYLKKSKTLFYSLVVIGLSLQILFAILFSSNIWVS